MTLEVQLDALEARILGVLIEKELTTPEQYPLSLNALVAGCNQKNNRDPVLDLLESEVYAGVQSLIRKFVVGSVHPAGSRVERFRHNAREVFKTDAGELAVLCELLLRGAQQPGELRARVARMAEIPTLERLSEVLKPLMERGLVRRLEPLPGTRAERYTQLLTPLLLEQSSAPVQVLSTAPAPPSIARAEFEELAAQVRTLQEKEARLRRQLDHLAWSLGKNLEG